MRRPLAGLAGPVDVLSDSGARIPWARATADTAVKAVRRAFTDLDGIARRLADRDHSGNIARIVAGVTLDDLRA